MKQFGSTRAALASPFRGCELPADIVAEIKAAAVEFDASPAEIIAGVRGHSFALIPTRAAQRIRTVETTAGLPPGTIVSKFVIALVSSWTESAPRALATWLERHFEFHGDALEKTAIAAELYQLRTRWRTDDAQANDDSGGDEQ
jgi:hypothetical protein